ncbi:MAG TPA: class I SAM-dependent methyltransferase [Candidatus Dormibacteraeota bacterium]|nr:class I SAM-dependent methyltransferase [Candidatus Dormibacteraeota bacterium]
MESRPSEVVAARDPPDELALALERWAARVRDNREQVDRIREVPDGDFYAPVTALFRADPDRTDDPQLDALLALTRPDERWLDIGAGAGRFALPLARHVRRVIAIDPSDGMLAALRESMAEAGVSNIDVRQGRWPEAWASTAPTDERPDVDVALMAHVGYDIEAIGPFLDAMEDAAARLCVAILMERQPSSSADRFWPPVHGQERVSLPGWPEFVEILRLRGRSPEVEEVTRPRRAFESLEQVETFVRRQLWVAPGGPKDARMHEVAPTIATRDADGWYLERSDPGVAIVTWVPRGRREPDARGGDA